MATPITFVVPGIRTAGAQGMRGGTAFPILPPLGRLKHAVTVVSARGEGEANVRVDAVPGEDVVVVQIVGGPELWLHPESARELLQAQQDPLAARDGRPTLQRGDVGVPVRLQWRLEQASPARGATRGFLGDVLVRAVHVVTGFAEDKAADFAASKVVQRFDSQVDAGVYQLDPGRLTSLKGERRVSIGAGNGPSLVLVHGTFSQTSGTFGKLWSEHPQPVGRLFERYGGRVYALDHPTLGVSPIANAVTLAEAAPTDARLHLVTHSRGGLVAEVLARICADRGASIADFPGRDRTSTRELKTLAALVAKKRIQVDRVVRVACPTRGTLLASKRLDAYVSVLKWALDLAHVPVVPQLVEFLGEVARRRAQPDALPGLAAQMPDSPLVQWLHAEGAPVLPGDLRVVAGDLQGDSVITWVKTLMSDAFFWTDNDLVVQTSSMYGGTRRAGASVFLLDQGGAVSHFNYFSHERTASAVVRALTDDRPDEFREIGPLSWSGESSTGVRAALVPRRPEQAAELPALFLLPGILGSNLRVGRDRIWLGWRLVNGFGRLAYRPGSDRVEPDGPIGAYYADLAAFFASSYDVRPFAFDWRRPMRAEAARLATEVAKALDARRTSRQPVRIIAHSMGGLVARLLQVVSRATWERLLQADGARLLMLGTPNAGSWAPMQVLSGDDAFGNLLTSVGAPFRGNATRQLIAEFPGFIELQAGLPELGRTAVWKALAQADAAALRAQSIWHNLPLQLAQFEWGVPRQPVLDEALALRRDLDRQRERDLPAFAHKLLLVVGRAPSTPAGYESTAEGVVYRNVVDVGDGRVTLESALLPGVETWVADADHGELPRHKDAFKGYQELLESGKTDVLPRLAPTSVARDAADAVRPMVVLSRPARASVDASPPERETDVLASTVRTTPEAAGPALHVTVENGDLTYTPGTLLLGHYRSSRLMGAEATMDRATGGAMSASLARGLYPVAAGEHQVFINVRQAPDNPWQLPRPEAVVVAGLGAEGELRGSDLANSVRAAVLGWAQRLTERTPIPATFPLSATLLGSGGSGVTPGQAAQLIAEGVREANDRLAEDPGAGPRWPRVDQLTLIELYQNRASEAWNALQALASSSPDRYVVAPTIGAGIGALNRPPDEGYRGADYDFISALLGVDAEGRGRIVYTVNTKRARTDVRPQPIQLPLVEDLVATAAEHANTDTEIGRTLFRLLVPVDLEPFMGSSTETVLELDARTAGIPWEILETPAGAGGNREPWSIRTKLLRKLRVSRSSPVPPTDATADDTILVIGDPACDRTIYPILAGARREAREVAAALAAATAGTAASSMPRVTSVVSGSNPGDPEPDARTVVNALMRRPWRIIHIAGHGAPPEPAGAERPDPRGVVLSGHSFLGPTEIGDLRVIPELVFVNCCHLARSSPDPSLNVDRARFAAGVAESLIAKGVRAVVAAGWAVDDDAASAFAGEFYRQLLGGKRFIDAVAAARAEARALGGNTWAAYQCYGDADWTFRQATGDAQRPAAPAPGREFAGIASASSLILALDAIAVTSESQPGSAADQPARLRYLEATFAPAWQHRGDVAEAFGRAWWALRDAEAALVWYERARGAEDGAASLAAVEQLANVRSRRAWDRVSANRSPAPAALAEARREIAGAMMLLDSLSALGRTVERESIYGSSYKRLALIEQMAGREADERAAIARMWEHYRAAEDLARAAASRPEGPPQPVFYPAMNRMAAQLAMPEALKSAEAGDAATIASIRDSMSSVPPDFWSVVGQTELDLYAALFDGRLAEQVAPLVEKLRAHHERVASARKWASVYDNATFVLSKYRARVGPAEAAAVDRLLGELASFARGSAPSAAPPPRPGRAPRVRRSRPAKRRQRSTRSR